MKIDINTNNDVKDYNVHKPEKRQAKGFYTFPYPVKHFFRYLFNLLFNGYFSYINPDHGSMKRLKKEHKFENCPAQGDRVSKLKIIFLGDIMISRSKEFPEIDDNLRAIIASADIIVANVESPVTEPGEKHGRGLGVDFKMHADYLETLYKCNEKAKWVLSVANNHAYDNSSRKDPKDESGVAATAKNIRKVIPGAEIIGADKVDGVKPVLSLKLGERGPNLAIIGWTELMNHDFSHINKGVVRETDLTDETLAEIRKDHKYVIGFAHANEEQSYYPLKETRDRQISMIGKDKFDVIVGHGPHVIHPAEQVGEEGLLFNSIGDFTSPKGKSQTKVGLVPELDLTLNGDDIVPVGYKVNIIEQNQKEHKVQLLTDPDKAVHGGIISRLKSMWKGLF